VTGYPSAQLVVQAAQLAANWQRKANGRLSAAEKKAQKKLKRLIKSPAGKVVFANLIDQCFRSADNRRIADQFHHQLMLHGLPEFFTPFEKFLLLIFLTLGRRLPALAAMTPEEWLSRASHRTWRNI
jgi:RHH-type proline utilization regulon transcriptional repressor/proline dehydrogenase/delta 1-pyrroline-5-carboxylate dehydrogenase